MPGDLITTEDLIEEQRRVRHATLTQSAVLEHPGPFSLILNPPRWEFGHLVWFQERFVLERGEGRRPFKSDYAAMFDSIDLRHENRWVLDIPPWEELYIYSEAMLQRVGDVLEGRGGALQRALAALAVHHEHYHSEAFAMAHQELGLPSPVASSDGPPAPAGAVPPTAAEFAGGPFLRGASADAPWFVFDNERGVEPVTISAFSLDCTTVNETEFLDFVEDGGYDDPRHWCREGWQWKQRFSVGQPAHWRKSAGAWHAALFGQLRPLSERLPVSHVSAFEADAFCRWSGRRLPTEMEWEFAATDGDPGRRYPWGSAPPTPHQANLGLQHRGPCPSDALADGATQAGILNMIGNVWEWTASRFAPYAGFTPGPYREFSEPWFHAARVVRGGSFATPPLLARATLRNFFEPCRRDLFVGFRTCAR